MPKFLFFVMDGVDEIFVQDYAIFAAASGETIRMGAHHNGLVLNIVNGEIWAEGGGEFFHGQISHDMFYLTMPQPTKLWSADTGFIPNQLILTGRWQIFSSSDPNLHPPTNVDRFAYTFREDGTKFTSVVFADVAYGALRWSPIPDTERQWTIMQDGRLKIGNADFYEIFNIQLSRDQDSQGIFNALVLSNSDFNARMVRAR